MQVDQLTAGLKGDEATIEAAQLNSATATSPAPFDGRLGLRQVDAGNLVHASDSGGIMTITQVQPIAVVFTLPQRRPAADRRGDGGRAGDGHRLVGRRQSGAGAGNAADPGQRHRHHHGHHRLKATFANAQNRLWPGQFVEARLLLRTERQVVAVPAQAVQHGQDSLYVYVVKPDSTVQRQPVEAEDRGAVMVDHQGPGCGPGDRAGRAVAAAGRHAGRRDAARPAAKPDGGGNERRMSISTPFIQRPIATSLVMAALVLVGIAAYPLLPVAPLPRVDFPTIVVTGKLPGASPETMAATVAQPLETQIAQIPGVAQLTSVSVLGTTSVTVQFDLDRNIDGAAGDIQAAIQGAGGQLPKIMPGPPTYRKVNPSDAPIMILAAQSDALPLIETDDYAENVLSQQISQISGVAQVVIGGQQKRAVRVQADPDRLAAMGMTLEDVRNLLVSATVNAPKGSIDGAHQVLHHLRQ